MGYRDRGYSIDNVRVFSAPFTVADSSTKLYVSVIYNRLYNALKQLMRYYDHIILIRCVVIVSAKLPVISSDGCLRYITYSFDTDGKRLQKLPIYVYRISRKCQEVYTDLQKMICGACFFFHLAGQLIAIRRPWCYTTAPISHGDTDVVSANLLLLKQ
jgi:hypothetical protein